MAFNLVMAIAIFGVANAAVVVPAVTPVVRTAAPLAIAPAPVEADEYDSHPQYKYGYDVQDTISGDSKGHIEERDGDVVRGEYSLIDADGFKRTVTYTADAVYGFNAAVRREPLAVAAPVVKTAHLVNPVVPAPASVLKSAPIVGPASVVRASVPFPYSAQVVSYQNL